MGGPFDGDGARSCRDRQDRFHLRPRCPSFWAAFAASRPASAGLLLGMGFAHAGRVR